MPGVFQLFSQDSGTKEWVETSRMSNQLQFDWGFIAARCLGYADPTFRLAYIYLEYQNMVNIVDSVTPPAFGRNEGVGYYTSLIATGNKDFLRIPIAALPALQVMPITGPNNYPAYFGASGLVGNRLSFFAQSEGTTGVGGKPFSSASNSKIYGIAIVAAPIPATYTSDRIYARGYYPALNQLAKLPDSQVGAGYFIEFP